MRRGGQLVGSFVLAACVLAACGGDADDGAAAADTSTTAGAETTTSTSAEEPVEERPSVGTVDDFEPGPISYRFVHAAPQFGDVDVYARTGQGVVEEYLIQESVAFGDVLDDLRPPVDGGLLVVPAGDTDLNPFTNDDVVGDLSTVNAGEQGPSHTLVLHPQDDGDDGVQINDYWESPDPTLLGTNANALPPPVSGQGLVVIANDAEDDSVYVARPGAGSCLAPQPPATANTAVGGTVVQAFASPPGPNELAFHSFADQDFDCTAPPVLTLTVDVPADGRTFVLIHDDGSGGLATMTFPLP